MSEIYFSKRLSGWGGHAVFLFPVALSILSLLGWFGGSPIALFTLLLLLVAYGIHGTVGWRRTLNRRSTVHRYFFRQFVFITFLLAAELSIGVRGLSTTILGFSVMTQSAVLPARPRISLFLCLLLVGVLFYTLSMGNIQQVALSTLIFAPLYSIGLFLGLLIVREEQARETSLKLDESNRKLAQYAAEIEDYSTLRERNRLAREIHDSLGHYLTAVNMQLEVALLSTQENTPARSALLKAQTLTKEALSEIRRSIRALRATPLENRPLHEALSLLVEEHCAAGYRAALRVVGTPYTCSQVVEMAFYRIAQEGLTNIRKHAQSESAGVLLDYSTPPHVMLEIRDNGVGSDNPEAGFGLLGMRERVQLLGGTLTIETAKGQGFVLRVTMT